MIFAVQVTQGIAMETVPMFPFKQVQFLFSHSSKYAAPASKRARGILVYCNFPKELEKVQTAKPANLSSKLIFSLINLVLHWLLLANIFLRMQTNADLFHL